MVMVYRTPNQEGGCRGRNARDAFRIYQRRCGDLTAIFDLEREPRRRVGLESERSAHCALLALLVLSSLASQEEPEGRDEDNDTCDVVHAAGSRCGRA